MGEMQTGIEYLKGVGPERARLLKEELNIRTFEDLLHFFPNRYIDRSQFYPINQLPQNNSEVQIKGKITQIEYVSQKRGKRMVAQFEDATGAMELVWFRGYQWIRESLKLNQPYVIFGRLNWFKGKASMPHPEMELEENFQKGVKAAFYPIYPSTEKLIKQRNFPAGHSEISCPSYRKGRHSIFRNTPPPYLLDHYKLIAKEKALKEVHYPTTQYDLSRAQARLKFEEFFYLQMQLILKNLQRKKKIKGFTFSEVGSAFHTFFKEHLPLSPYPSAKTSRQGNSNGFRIGKTNESSFARRCGFR